MRIVAAEFVQPFIVRVENGALEGFVDNTVKLPGRTGKKHLSLDAVAILVFKAGGRLPTAEIILVTELLVEANGLEVFFLFDF